MDSLFPGLGPAGGLRMGWWAEEDVEWALVLDGEVGTRAGTDAAPSGEGAVTQAETAGRSCFPGRGGENLCLGRARVGQP